MHRATLTAWCSALSWAAINFSPAPPLRTKQDGTWCRIPYLIWPVLVSWPGCVPSWPLVSFNPILAQHRTVRQSSKASTEELQNHKWSTGSCSLDTVLHPGLYHQVVILCITHFSSFISKISHSIKSTELMIYFSHLLVFIWMLATTLNICSHDFLGN